MNSQEQMDKKTTAVIRGLIMDGTRKANSGHPGGAMSSTDMAYVLFKHHLKYDPDNTLWINRDRFVLSAGHESMLLYSLLHLQGHLSIDELMRFRQLHSLTPGHPEHGLTKGVDASTGPLGQGFGMSVGMAIAEAALAAQLGTEIIDHYTYAIAGDGDLQEPVALGAAATAGHQGLGKLIVFYDKNGAQISGSTDRADSTDLVQVFKGFGWQVIEIDGHNHAEINQAITQAQNEKDRPSLIIGHTIMAKGAAHVEGDFHTHGSPLKEEEIQATKEKLGLPSDQKFYVSDDVYRYFQSDFSEKRDIVSQWNKIVADKSESDTEFAQRINSILNGDQFENITVPEFKAGEKMATRDAFGKTLAHIAQQTPFLIGGSADLEPSNQTKAFADTVGEFTKSDRSGRNISFAVREFPMAAMVNGIALHGGFKPFGATFLVFSDYAKAAMRLSAIQELPVLFVYTHDSFYVGEDGPTHEPVEQLAGLRAIPKHIVFRPCDARETAVAMKLSMEIKNRPVSLALTRQGLPTLDTENLYEKVKKGAYILKGEEHETPDVILIASGSEVHLALKAAEELKEMKVRVVSMPSMELFDEQPKEYKNHVLSTAAQYRVSIEALSTFGWGKYVANGWSFGVDHFGLSAPAEELEKEFGFTPENIARLVRERKDQ
ncbi:MAG: transketolase [Bacteroidales bacterium]|nr:transketolase [Bacteroidales bacterium]